MEKMEKKNDSCVTINVFVNCDECDKKDDYVSYNSEKDDKCADINVYVECDKKEEKREKKEKRYY